MVAYPCPLGTHPSVCKNDGWLLNTNTCNSPPEGFLSARYRGPEALGVNVPMTDGSWRINTPASSSSGEMTLRYVLHHFSQFPEEWGLNPFTPSGKLLDDVPFTVPVFPLPTGAFCNDLSNKLLMLSFLSPSQLPGSPT